MNGERHVRLAGHQEPRPQIGQVRAQIERRADGAGWRQLAGLDVTWRPSPMLLLSVEPQFERNRIGAQYVTTSTSLPYTPTFGARYLFADLDRTELSVPTRLNVTMSPRLTLQLFAQPLLSAGNYLVIDQANLQHRLYPAARGKQRPVLNRDIQKMFEPLRVTEQFLLKSNIREVLFRKNAAPAVAAPSPNPVPTT